MKMKISKIGIALIKHFEGFEPRPYYCPAGVVTIGYGSTWYENGKPVRITDPAITEPDAMELLLHAISVFEADVNSLVKAPITQAQFDALVSFAFNVGSDIDSDDIAEGLGDSTLLKLINRNIMMNATDWKCQISNQFYSWKYAGKKNGKKIVSPGLVRRRSSEALLFTESVLKFFK